MKLLFRLEIMVAAALLVVILTAPAVQMARAQGPDDDSLVTPTPSGCTPLTNKNIIEVVPLSKYPVFRNPLLELHFTIDGESGNNTVCVSLADYLQIGKAAEVSVHCELSVVGLADNNNQYFSELAVTLDAGEGIVKAFAFCQQVNLLNSDVKSVGGESARRFPKEGDALAAVDMMDSSQEKDDLKRLVTRATSGQCPDDLSSFTTQLAVFMIFYRNQSGVADSNEIWDRFAEGNIPYPELEQIQDAIFCLLADSSITRPLPTPIPTETLVPTDTPVPSPTSTIEPTPTITLTPTVPTSVPFMDESVPKGNTVWGETVQGVLVRLIVLVTGSIVILVLIRIRRARLVGIIMGLVIGVVVLLVVTVGPESWFSDDDSSNTLTPVITPAETPASIPATSTSTTVPTAPPIIDTLEPTPEV